MAISSTEVIIDNTPLTVDGSAVTQPISAVSLPLPAGASTSAKQPALGVAGTPSADVISVQGVSGGTAFSVVSGTIASATVTRVSVGVAATTLLAARAARVAAVIFNEAGTLFVKYGSAASATDYTIRLTANTITDVSNYSGIITAIKVSGTTSVQVTDI